MRLVFQSRLDRLFEASKHSRMSWRSHGNSNEELVNNLQHNGLFKDARVRAAMLATDRADFTDSIPYMDCPVSIGHNATISAPHVHAAALQHLAGQLHSGARVLDVGSGSGYLTVCMAHMVGPTGMAVGIDHIDELVQRAEKNTRKHHANLLDSQCTRFVCGDGRLGWPEAAPYDAIHVGAAADQIPQPLLDQLAPGGRMLIPVGGEGQGQEFMRVDKHVDGRITRKNIMDVIYVPLTSREHQLGTKRAGITGFL